MPETLTGEADTTRPRRAPVVWYGSLTNHHLWPEDTQQQAIKFFAAHGLDKRDVPASGTDNARWEIRHVGDGLELRGWVFNLDLDGHTVLCEHCPSCVRMRPVSMALKAPVPLWWPDSKHTQEPAVVALLEQWAAAAAEVDRG